MKPGYIYVSSINSIIVIWIISWTIGLVCIKHTTANGKFFRIMTLGEQEYSLTKLIIESIKHISFFLFVHF